MYIIICNGAKEEYKKGEVCFLTCDLENSLLIPSLDEQTTLNLFSRSHASTGGTGLGSLILILCLSTDQVIPTKI